MISPSQNPSTLFYYIYKNMKVVPLCAVCTDTVSYPLVRVFSGVLVAFLYFDICF